MSARPLRCSGRCKGQPPLILAGAIAPGHAVRVQHARRGPKPPARRPSRPWRALRTRQGRALASVMRADRVLQSRGRGGRGKAMPFLIRPARPALSQGRAHYSGQGLAGAVFCSLPRFQAFLKQLFAIPPSRGPLHWPHPPISAPCSPGATTTPAACGRPALKCQGAPSRSVTIAPARVAISATAAMSHTNGPFN